MSDPILYSFRRCPYAMRARLALAVSGIRHEHREVSLASKPVDLFAVSPKGTVPGLLLTDGTTIDESLAIMRWALTIADPEGWLARDDPDLIAVFDGRFKHDLDRYKYADRYGADPFAHREGALVLLREVDARLVHGGQLCGSSRGIADAAIMPFIRQFAAVDRAWFDAQPQPNLKAWLRGHMTSDLFNRIMFRVAPWSAADRSITVNAAGVGRLSGAETDEADPLQYSFNSDIDPVPKGQENCSHIRRDAEERVMVDRARSAAR